MRLGRPPLSWGESIITLIHKKGPEEDPTNFRMIALSSTIGKLFNLILSRRLTTYLLENGIIDSAIQKAFLPNISGCFEHNMVMQEAIKYVRAKKKTMHITFFDLADAFGSVPHQLIMHTLETYQLPINIREYMANYLQQGWAMVKTKSWSSERFKFARGVFQGDPLSPIIFIWIFNPIIKAIQQDPKLGINIKGQTIATLPFADDFCLITTNKRTHQKAINTINRNIISMGLCLKPAKCRSFSLSSGRPDKIIFTIGDSLVPSIADEDQYYLGAKVFFLGKESEVLTELSSNIKSKLENIDSTAVRNEYKVAVYSRYLLPSLRFLLTVHDLTATSRRSLDSLCDKYLKKWTGVARSGTNIILHSSKALNIPTIQELYRECHALSHSSARIQGDTAVNAMLDSKIAREGEWTRKTSTVCDSESLLLNAESKTPIGLSPNSKLSWLKGKVKQQIKEDGERKRAEHAKKLISQGHLLALLEEMKMDATWQSYLHALPKGTMKFILNSSINTLPTKANLKLWGKSKSDKCTLCGRIQTLNHVLSSCPKFLEQGRYTYRHNNIIKEIVENIDRDNARVYADIEGHTIGGGTVPPDILVTSEKPDIVIIHDPETAEKKHHITIIELTVPWEERLRTSREHKTNKYSSLVSDIQAAGFSVDFIPLEVGVRGIIDQDNKESIKLIKKVSKSTVSLKSLISSISKRAVISSYYIFLSRNDQNWID